MKKLALAVLVMTLVVVVTVPSVILLVETNIRVSAIPNLWLRSAAIAVEFFLGVAWLLGTVYLSTRMVVRIYRRVLPPAARIVLRFPPGAG
jgi:hypothetical protein